MSDVNIGQAAQARLPSDAEHEAAARHYLRGEGPYAAIGDWRDVAGALLRQLDLARSHPVQQEIGLVHAEAAPLWPSELPRLMHNGLEAVAEDVRRNWRASDYPAHMQRATQQFRHANLHAVKALGKIAAIIDHEDHDQLTGDEGQASLQDLEKLIGDLVRCAAKMAEAVALPMSFAGAVIRRALVLSERWAQHRTEK